MFTNWLTNSVPSTPATSRDLGASAMLVDDPAPGPASSSSAAAAAAAAAAAMASSASSSLMATPPDVMLEVGPAPSVRFVAHSVVLGMHSGYLRSAIRLDEHGAVSGGRGHHADSVVLYLGNVTAEQFAPLLTYMYSGYLDLNVENIFGVLLATHVLHMPRALEICRSFLARAQSEGYLSSALPPPAANVAAASAANGKIIRPIPSKATALPNFGFVAPPMVHQQHPHLPAFKALPPPLPTSAATAAAASSTTNDYHHQHHVGVSADEMRNHNNNNNNSKKDHDDEDDEEVFIDSHDDDEDEGSAAASPDLDCDISVASSRDVDVEREIVVVEEGENSRQPRLGHATAQQLESVPMQQQQLSHQLQSHQLQAPQRRSPQKIQPQPQTNSNSQPQQQQQQPRRSSDAKTSSSRSASKREKLRQSRQSSGGGKQRRQKSPSGVGRLQVANAPILASELDRDTERTVTTTAAAATAAAAAAAAESSKVIVDVASCDGPVRFRRILNTAYGHKPDGSVGFASSSSTPGPLPTPTERSQQSVSLSFHQQMARTISLQRQQLQHAEESENSESSGSGHSGAATAIGGGGGSGGGKKVGGGGGGGGGEVYVCVYCKHSFKSQYCYQKHAKRHLNPLSLSCANALPLDVAKELTTTPTPTTMGCGGPEPSTMSEGPMASSSLRPSSGSSSALPTGLSAFPTPKEQLLRREVRPLDMNVQYYPCKTCGSKFPSYYFVHKHRKLCHADEEAHEAETRRGGGGGGGGSGGAATGGSASSGGAGGTTTTAPKKSD